MLEVSFSLMILPTITNNHMSQDCPFLIAHFVVDVLGDVYCVVDTAAIRPLEDVAAAICLDSLQ